LWTVTVFNTLAPRIPLAARWGGEEFVILAGHGSTENVQTLGDWLRLFVEQSTVEYAGHTLNVTISLGATLSRDDDDGASLFGRVDRLSYLSKFGGRNRVTFEL